MSDQPEARIVRTPDELQQAHDLLVGLILDSEMRAVLGPDQDGKILIAMVANADVLCWILGHDHNHTFSDNLEGIQDVLAERGYALHDTGELQRKAGVSS